MSSQREREEDCRQAYRLALYILGDERAAEMAVVHALDALHSSRRQEWERRAGRTWYKLCPNKDFKLHRLVWEHCTPAEQEQERAHREGRFRLDEEAMIVRYVKEILADGLSRNSFRLHVGLLRVLCAYPTRDAQRLYEVLVPDGSGGREEDAYRRRKQRIMERLEERFRDFLRAVNVGGEKRFSKKEDSADGLRLVEECLALFTPLKPRCPKLPGKFDPTTDIVEEFESPRPKPSADVVTRREMEYSVERCRVHAQVHPPCRAKTLEMAGLREFGEMLEVPEFFPEGGDGPPPLDRRDLPALGGAQQRRISFALGQLRARRERTPADELIVTVDHVERGVLRLNAPLKLRLELGAGDRMIEFSERGAGGGFRLATHLLQWDDEASAAGPEAYRLKLKDGRKIEFELNYLTRDEELAGAVADFSYSKGRSPWLFPVAAGALLLTAAASLLIYKHGRRTAAGQLSDRGDAAVGRVAVAEPNSGAG